MEIFLHNSRDAEESSDYLGRSLVHIFDRRNMLPDSSKNIRAGVIYDYRLGHYILVAAHE
jgi:hypothetical protein